MPSPPHPAPRASYRSSSPGPPRATSTSRPPRPSDPASPQSRPLARAAFSDGEDAETSRNMGYRSLLDRMEPRAASVDHEPTARRMASVERGVMAAQGGNEAEGYEKELGEISPEVSRRVVGPGLVPPPRAAVDDVKREVGLGQGDAAPTLAGSHTFQPTEDHGVSTGQPLLPDIEDRKDYGVTAVPVVPITDSTHVAVEMPKTMTTRPTEGQPSQTDPPAARASETSNPPAPSSSANTPMDVEPSDGRHLVSETTTIQNPTVSPESTARASPPMSAVQPIEIDPRTTMTPSAISKRSIPSPPPIPCPNSEAATDPATDPATPSLITGTTLADHGVSVPDSKEKDAPAATSPLQGPSMSKMHDSVSLADLKVPSTAEPLAAATNLASRNEGVVMKDATVASPSDVSHSSAAAIKHSTATELTVAAEADGPSHEDDSTSKMASPETASAENAPASQVMDPVETGESDDIDMEPTPADHASPKAALPPNPTNQEKTGLPESDMTTDGQPTTTDIRPEMGSASGPVSTVHSVAERLQPVDPDTSDLTSLPSYETVITSRRTQTDVATSERSQADAPTEILADDAQESPHPGEAVHSTLTATQPVSERDGVDQAQSTAVSSADMAHANQPAATASDTLQQDPAHDVPINSVSSVTGPNDTAASVNVTAEAVTPKRPASPHVTQISQAEDPQDPARTSPTPPPATRAPKPLSPRVVQRMLEKQIVLGRQSIMIHARAKQKELEAKIVELKRQYRKLDKQWESHKTRTIAENEALARQFEAVPNPVVVQDPKPGGRKTRRGFVEQDHELMGFRDGDDEALAKALKAIEEMMEADPTQRALKTEATIPDMELDPDIWRLAYVDENALVADPLAFYGHGVGEPPGEWTEEEERKFRKLYVAYPKQFGEIARGLANKTTAQCVKHYYLTKKKRPFKEGANRNGQRQAAGGQAARMVAPVTREKVELAGVLATGDRAQARQVADDIRAQGEGRKAGKRKADEAERSSDQSARDSQKAKRKSGSKKRMVDIATAGDRAANGDALAAKKRKTSKKPSRLDLKERAQSASNRSSSSRGPSTGPPTSEFALPKGPLPGVFMPDASALPPRLINHPLERPQSTPIVTWQDQQSRPSIELQGASLDRTVRATQTLPPENAIERRHGGMNIMSLLNDVGAAGPSGTAADAAEGQ